MFDITRPNNSLMLLSPWLRSRIETALRELHAAGIDIFIFEGFRARQRQDWLYEQGRTREGTIITNAKGGNSWHELSLAIDMAYKPGNRWSWDGDFSKPAPIMKKHGFTWGGDFKTFKDMPHYQLDGGMTLQEAKAIRDQWSLAVLWQEVELRIIDKLPKLQV